MVLVQLFIHLGKNAIVCLSFTTKLRWITDFKSEKDNY